MQVSMARTRTAMDATLADRLYWKTGRSPPASRKADFASLLITHTRAIIPSLAALGIACTQPVTTPRMDPAVTAAAPDLEGDNPFSAPSTLPFQAPVFDRIRIDHFQPALEAGMRQQRAEVDVIASQADAPTFENTIVALERTGLMLRRVHAVFGALTQANTSDALQEVQRIEGPRLAAHSDAIQLDPALFARIKQIHDRRDELGLDAEQRMLVERYYRDYVRAGALLAEPEKARLRAINQESAKLSISFANTLLAATKAGALVLDHTFTARWAERG